MINKIKLAHKRCDGAGYVTLRALRTELNLKSWDDLKENDSSLAEVLLSPAFKNESLNQTEDQIDVKWLSVWAILKCKATIEQRSYELFRAIYESGPEMHSMIPQDVKIIEPIF